MVYSEFNTRGADGAVCDKAKFACDVCVMPESYKWSGTECRDGMRVCKFCASHKNIELLGEERFISDLGLGEGEKIGITVSGGKDSVYAWYWLASRLGADRVVALNYRKTMLTHPFAIKNVENAARILGSEVITVEDNDAYPRFKQNLSALLDKPTPEMVRVALCAGCRYGITARLYAEGYERLGITKYVSAASYLELAPFKEELLAERGGGNAKYGLICSLADNCAYSYGDNLEVILRDDDFKYKGGVSSSLSTVTKRGRYQLFDTDKYLPNVPELIEKTVVEKLGWQRPERSWHFDCMIEHFKDVFYYGTLGYTESDFKLSAMVRHGLMTREQAVSEIAAIGRRLCESLPETEALMSELGVGELIPKMRKFYENSPYLYIKVGV